MNLPLLATTTLLSSLSWHQLSSSTRERILIGGALLAVVLATVCWAVYFRKQKRGSGAASRHERHRHDDRHRSASRGEMITDRENSDRRRVKRWRKRRRGDASRSDEGRRNPTRAETGGLMGRLDS